MVSLLGLVHFPNEMASNCKEVIAAGPMTVIPSKQWTSSVKMPCQQNEQRMLGVCLPT